MWVFKNSKCWFLENIYWDESIKIPYEYVFFYYRLRRNYGQSLTLKFVNFIWEEHMNMNMKMKGVLILWNMYIAGVI